MKKLKIIALFVLAMQLIACEDYLEPDPLSSVVADGYFTNDDELAIGIINIYDGIQGINSTTAGDNHAIQIEYQLTEMRSDNTQTKNSEGEPAQFESFDVQATNGVVSEYYSSFYNVIFRANLVLDNLGAASEGAAPGFEAEAKFLRAYAYFNLVRLFGDIPLVTTVISPTDSETAYTRVPVSDIYDLLVDDLEVAVANLDNSFKNRASRAAAQTLLAKVHLNLGNYGTAQTLIEDVIGDGDYSLEPNYNDVFYNEGNDEIIFAIGYASGLANDSQNFSAEFMNAVGRSAGLNYVTDEARAAIDAFGGNRIADTYRQDRLQTQFYQVAKYLPNGEDGGSDGKTFVSDATLAGNDWIVLRYADVLLLHVEAIMAGGAQTSNTDAVASFQAVRNRANLTTPVTTITKQDLMDERRVELAFENHRLFDLIRMGEAETVLGAFATANGYAFSAADLLLPIPQREINLSRGLMSQNPGY